jgi:hypothetical protein
LEHAFENVLEQLLNTTMQIANEFLTFVSSENNNILRVVIDQLLLALRHVREHAIELNVTRTVLRY